MGGPYGHPQTAEPYGPAYSHDYWSAHPASMGYPGGAPWGASPGYYGSPYPYPYSAYPHGPQGPGQAGAHARHGAGMADLMEEIAKGGNGLSSLSKMLSLDDSEFWKGALVGAAAVLLLTNESVQEVLFKTGARAKQAVKAGIDKAKGTSSEAPTDE